MILYLDSSAIVKRYVEEKGSGIVRDAYARAILVEFWSFVLKYHMYQAGALQIVSAKRAGAEAFYAGDRELADTASNEGLKVVRLED